MPRSSFPAFSKVLQFAGALLLILGLTGCQSALQPPAAVSSTPSEPVFAGQQSDPSEVTFAFEPLTGAPGNIADELSSQLGVNAASQGLSVVRRVGADATYRVNGYLAATGQSGKGTIFYVFDIVDRSGKRLKRISGSEETGGATGDPWQSATEGILSRIANRTVVEIKAWLNQ